MMKEDANISRRKFLVRGPGAVLGGALALGVGSSLIKPSKAHAAMGYLPCDSSHLLDLDRVTQLAWKHFHLSGG